MKTPRLIKTKSFRIFSFMLFTLLAFNTINAQANSNTVTNERTIKGTVSNADGMLADVNVTQKGTNNGTVTNAKGKFTFPVKLKTGDILVFSYLGYETQEVKIKATTDFIKLVLTEDLVEMIGALDSAKPYKSKRKN